MTAEFYDVKLKKKVTVEITEKVTYGQGNRIRYAFRAKTDQKLVIQKTDKYIKYINCLERSAKLSDGDSSMHKQAKKFKEDLFDKRKAGLAKIGIFSIENLIFKILRTKGHIERLDNIINKSYDSQFSEE